MVCRILRLLPNISSLLMSSDNDIQCGLALISMQWPSVTHNILKSSNIHFLSPERLTKERKKLQLQNFWYFSPCVHHSSRFVALRKRLVNETNYSCVLIALAFFLVFAAVDQLIHFNYHFLLAILAKASFQKSKDWSIQRKGSVF